MAIRYNTNRAPVESKIIVPIQKIALSTEPGARISTAYNAHLEPFYQKHGAVAVNCVYTFVSETAAPLIKQATKPVCDAVHRAIDPHTENIAAAYSTHAKPTVDAIKDVLCSAANTAIIPAASVVSRHTAYVFNQYAVPCVRSAALDYVAPFYIHHIRPRWNDQIRPALCSYVKVGVRYTRTSVLPAIVDGTAYGYKVSRDFASTHIVPYVKGGTIRAYTLIKQHVCPHVNSLYDQTLKHHVDRVVPWDKVKPVTDKLLPFFSGTAEFFKGLGEELYYMFYTILTGDEHPSVVQRLRDAAAAKSTRKDSGFMDSLKLPITTEEDGRIHSVARRFSGSARQWIQIARGWVGSAAGSAKDNLASYGSRATATAFDIWNQATSVASEATDLVDEQTTYVEPVASIIQSLATTASVSTESAEEAWTKATESVAASLTKEAAEDWSHATAAAATGAETAAEYIRDAESVASAIVESAEEPTRLPIASQVTEAAASIAEAVASYESIATDVIAKTLSDAAESAMLVKDDITEVATDIVDSATSITSAAGNAIKKTLKGAADVVVDRAVSLESSATESVADQLGKVVESASDVLETATDAAKRMVTSASDIVSTGQSVIDTIGPDSLIVFDTTSDAAASVTSAIASVLEESIDDGPSIPVPADILTKPSDSADSGASIIAEDAASAIYEVRDKMADLLMGDEEKEKFSDLVKSAHEAVDNLEDFPKVFNDVSDSLVSEATKAEEVLESIVEQATAHPVVSKASEKVTKATSVVAEKLTGKPVIPEFEKRADEMTSAAAEKLTIPNIVSKATEKAKVVTSAVDSIVESGLSAATDLSPVKRATEELSIDTPTVDNPAAYEQPTTDSESLAETVDEDVRKSALDWVRDARSSISKEVAEVRTRQSSPVPDATTSLSDMGERIPPLAEDVLIANSDSDTAVKEPAPEESAEQLLMDHTEPVMIKKDTVAPAATPKKRDSVKAPTKSGSPINPRASKSEKAVPAADVPPAPRTPASPPSPVDTTSKSTKGPRRIKKTKKRVVKKVA
ncbi:hypothetical protein H4R24_001151 [Coemansia sp. RSA 988]|nr:hypothetical protein H4R24_001151 [Coemansia sp. RSA 988]